MQSLEALGDERAVVVPDIASPSISVGSVIDTYIIAKITTLGPKTSCGAATEPVICNLDVATYRIRFIGFAPSVDSVASAVQ